MNTTLLQMDVFWPFTLFSVMFELKHLVYLVSTSYVCHVHITNRPPWQDELLNCQLYTGLDRSCLFSIDFLLLCRAWLDHIQQILETEAGTEMLTGRLHLTN